MSVVEAVLAFHFHNIGKLSCSIPCIQFTCYCAQQLIQHHTRGCLVTLVFSPEILFLSGYANLDLFSGNIMFSWMRFILWLKKWRLFKPIHITPTLETKTAKKQQYLIDIYAWLRPLLIGNTKKYQMWITNQGTTRLLQNLLRKQQCPEDLSIYVVYLPKEVENMMIFLLV